MKKAIILLLIGFSYSLAKAQNDPKSKAFINEFIHEKNIADSTTISNAFGTSFGK